MQFLIRVCSVGGEGNGDTPPPDFAKENKMRKVKVKGSKGGRKTCPLSSIPLGDKKRK